MKQTTNPSGNIMNKENILADFRLANLSRNLSIIGRREVLSGKAKFGIFGDGKEIVQIALAKQFRNGDWRSGYYRDQTWMMAMGLYDSLEFFHQLYGNTNRDINPEAEEESSIIIFRFRISILTDRGATLQNRKIHHPIFLLQQGRCLVCLDWLMRQNYSGKTKICISLPRFH